MTLHQALALAIVAAMLVLFVWDRLRYDVVAASALLVALLTGVVPAEKGFLGFGSPVVIVIASVLVLSRAIAVSGIVDTAMQRMLRSVRSPSLQIGVLTSCVTFLSAFMKNVGTLGIFMPIAIQTAQRSKRSPSFYLMPLAFGSLIGGTITQIGTSPNLLISTIREEITGTPFGMFDFTLVGLPLSCLAVLFLSVGWRLIPRGRTGLRSAERRFEIAHYISEIRVGAASPMVGRTVADLERLGEGELTVTAVIREGGRRYIPAGHWVLFENDILAVQADPVTIRRVLDVGRLELLAAGEHGAVAATSGEMETVEAVVTTESALIGKTPAALHLRRRFEVNLLGVSRGGRRMDTRLRSHRFVAGDVIILQGWEVRLPAALAELGCLPLADRSLALGRKRHGFLSVGILVVAMLLVAFQVLTVAVAFFAAAVLVVLFKQVTLKEAYDAIEWPVIIMLGALIPVGEALKDTGTAELLGNHLTTVAALVPGPMALALVLVVAMLVTPLLHHAAAVIVLGPIAATLAANLGFNPDPFLMAVALGAGCDFLTPIGHQNNAIIMAPGGYRFSDYWRLGLPLSLIVVLIGTPLLLLAWPL